jgi:hypothetical protein
VFILGAFDGLDNVAATATLTATGRGEVVLFDTPASRPRLPGVLRELGATRVVAVGRFTDSAGALASAWGVPVDGPLTWPVGGPPTPLWEVAAPPAAKAVVCPSNPPADFLEGVRLAGLMRVPLMPVGDAGRDGPLLRAWLMRWGTKEVVAVGDAGAVCDGLAGVRVVPGK